MHKAAQPINVLLLVSIFIIGVNNSFKVYDESAKLLLPDAAALIVLVCIVIMKIINV